MDNLKLYTDEEVDAILGMPEGLLPGERIAWVRDHFNKEWWGEGMSFQQIAFKYVGTEKDKSRICREKTEQL